LTWPVLSPFGLAFSEIGNADWLTGVLDQLSTVAQLVILSQNPLALASAFPGLNGHSRPALVPTYVTVQMGGCSSKPPRSAVSPELARKPERKANESADYNWLPSKDKQTGGPGSPRTPQPDQAEAVSLLSWGPICAFFCGGYGPPAIQPHHHTVQLHSRLLSRATFLRLPRH
jgi:hypothetical protein